MKKMLLMIGVAMSVLICSPAVQAKDLAKEPDVVCKAITSIVLNQLNGGFAERSPLLASTKPAFDDLDFALLTRVVIKYSKQGVDSDTLDAAINRAKTSENDLQQSQIIPQISEIGDRNGSRNEMFEFIDNYFKTRVKENNCFKIAKVRPSF